jgi:hypothetical protein
MAPMARRHARAMGLAQVRMPGQQAEPDQQVRLATAHGLLEVKNGLGGSARQAGDPLDDEVLHALVMCVFSKKTAPFPSALSSSSSCSIWSLSLISNAWG